MRARPRALSLARSRRREREGGTKGRPAWQLRTDRATCGRARVLKCCAGERTRVRVSKRVRVGQSVRERKRGGGGLAAGARGRARAGRSCVRDSSRACLLACLRHGAREARTPPSPKQQVREGGLALAVPQEGWKEWGRVTSRHASSKRFSPPLTGGVPLSLPQKAPSGVPRPFLCR